MKIKLQRLSFIQALSMAGKEGRFRRKAKPAVLPASSCTIGFTVSVDRASASGSSLDSLTAESSESESVVQEDNNLQNMHDILQEAEDHSKSPDRQAVLEEPGEPVGFDAENELAKQSPNLAARPEANSVGLAKALPTLQHAEEGSARPVQLGHAASPSQHAVPSAIAAAYILARMRLQNSATMPPCHIVPDRLPKWAWPHTGSPPRHAALSPIGDDFTREMQHFPVPVNMPAQVPASVADRLRGSPDPASPLQDAALSATDAASTFQRPHLQMPSPNTPAHVPLSVIDSLLNGGSPDTERCIRRKSKSPPPPRIKHTHARNSKQMLQDLRQPLLSRPSSAHTVDAAEASDGGTPLHHVNSQPCDGMWQKLGSSLSAVWRWLCKCGSTLRRLSRKVRKKLLTALGLSHAEAQALIFEQQASERDVLAVSPVVHLQHVEQPQSPSRLQRWRM